MNLNSDVTLLVTTFDLYSLNIISIIYRKKKIVLFFIANILLEYIALLTITIEMCTIFVFQNLCNDYDDI